MTFADLRLAEPLLSALRTEGYSTPTPIQAAAIPPALSGQDVLGCAQTGTGKTAAFALPILHRLFCSADARQAPARRSTRCLVLCPTRELASQIGESFRTYGREVSVRLAVIFGGVGERPQIQSLQRGVDVLVATPGRLLDLMNQGYVDLRGIEVFVLDEADRMLDMGFINDIRKVVARLPQKRQTMLFSATMPGEIRQLANSLLHKPATVQVAPAAATADRIDQGVYFVQRQNKPMLLAHLVNNLPISRAIVFTRTKHGADRVVRQLYKFGIRAEAIHGNKSQNARNRAMDNFRSSRTPILVATDIASRGIDIDDITHVVNFDLTHEPETYVHRIGRTARAGAAGVALSFCDQEEREHLQAIQKLIRRNIPVRTDHPDYADAPPAVRESARDSDAPVSGGQSRGRRQAQRPRQAAQRAPWPAASAPSLRTGPTRSTRGPGAGPSRRGKSGKRRFALR